jgi:hypothetical protein
VRRQHELDRQVEQRTQPPDDIVRRHVLATSELDLQSLAEVGERVPVTSALIDGSQKMRSFSSRPANASIPNGHDPGTVEVSLAFARAEPGEILTLHSAHVIGIDAELLDPILPSVCRRRVYREIKPTRVALMARAVSTTAVARSCSSVGTESGSNNRKSSPSAIPYDETSSGHHCSSFQSGCGDSQCKTSGRSSPHERDGTCGSGLAVA